MTAVILSYIFMVLFLTDPTLTIKDAQKVGPMLYRMPKVYFVAVATSPWYGRRHDLLLFVCRLSGHATASCLDFCFLWPQSPARRCPFVSTLFRASLIRSSCRAQKWSWPTSSTGVEPSRYE